MKNHWTDKKTEIQKEFSTEPSDIRVNFDLDDVHDCTSKKDKITCDTSFLAPNSEILIPSLECGSLTIVDKGGLGFDINADSEPICFFNAKNEQALVAWLLKKHEHDEKWFIKTIQQIYPKNYSGFPLDDARTLQQGDFGGQAKLDIFYSSQFVHNEVLQLNKDKTEGILCHTPVLSGSLTGMIEQNGSPVQSFKISSSGDYSYESFGLAWTTHYAKNVTLNLTTGEIYLFWFGDCPEDTKVIVSYEFNMEH